MTELLFKVIIIGDATVGKTSFVRRYVNNHPGREYKPTQGGRELAMFLFIFNGCVQVRNDDHSIKNGLEALLRKSLTEKNFQSKD